MGRSTVSIDNGLLNSRRSAAFMDSPRNNLGGRCLRTLRLKRYGAQKKLHRAVYTLREFVGAGDVDGPLANHRLIEALHELGEMKHGECIRDFSLLLTLDE